MNRVVLMLLVHDIGEIDTGDTIVFAERAAVERIFGRLAAAQAQHFLEH